MIRKPSASSPAALAVALVLAVACTRSAAADVVARVGDTDVTTEEVQAYLGTLAPRDQEALAKDRALLSQVVRSFLARKAVLGEKAAMPKSMWAMRARPKSAR